LAFLPRTYNLNCLRPFVMNSTKSATSKEPESTYAGAFENASHGRSEALFVMDDGAITKQRQKILDLAARSSLPVVAIYKDFARAGAVIAYGPSLGSLTGGLPTMSISF
jgi:hypothetical protein